MELRMYEGGRDFNDDPYNISLQDLQLRIREPFFDEKMLEIKEAA